MIMKANAINLVNSVIQEEMDAGLLAETYSVEAKKGKSKKAKLGGGRKKKRKH